MLTYRRNIKNQRNNEDFVEYKIESEGQQTTMKLYEKQVELNGVKTRELKRLTEDRHQTNVINTNKKLPFIKSAHDMFARRKQEKLYGYLCHEYNLD